MQVDDLDETGSFHLVVVDEEDDSAHHAASGRSKSVRFSRHSIFVLIKRCLDCLGGGGCKKVAEYVKLMSFMSIIIVGRTQSDSDEGAQTCQKLR